MPTWTGWPPRFTLTVYELSGEMFFRSRKHDFDLCDEIMRRHARRTVIVGIKTDSLKLLEWDENLIGLIEENFRYTFNHDGFKVRVTRRFHEGMETLDEARWQLAVYPML